MELAPIFTDNIIFAENRPVRVFGTGEGKAEAFFCGERASAVSDNGKWLIELPPRPAGGPFELTVALNGEQKTLRNVRIGKVYLVAGQSNAEFTLSESNTPRSDYAGDGMLSCFFVAREWCENEPMLMSDGWQNAKEEMVGSWSALGYLTGKYIRERASVPVGLVSCFQGASVIESWLPPEHASRFRLPDDKLYYDHYIPEYAFWNRNSVIYETMLQTIMPFSFSGVIWYQGESDASPDEAAVYADELACFFACVRSGFGDSKLPFAVVQIADCAERLKNNGEGWRGIQRAQRLAAEADEYARLVVSRDISETGFIHPPTKTLLAGRIADALLEMT